MISTLLWLVAPIYKETFMPLYEYFCENCQMDFTLLQSTNTNKEESECSECGSKNTRYKFSSFSAKIQGKPLADLQKPVTADDLPNKNVLKIPPARHISEYQ